MLLDREIDIAALPLEFLHAWVRDAYYPPSIPILSSHMTNEKLPTNTVCLYGMGADLYKVTGKTFPVFSRYGTDKLYRWIRMFGIKIPKKDVVRRDQFSGMSGSPICLGNERGDITGIFHSSWWGYHKDYAVLCYSGPDELHDATVRGAAIWECIKANHTTEELQQLLQGEKSAPPRYAFPGGFF